MEKAVLDHYNSPAGVADYTTKFKKHWTERINNVREQSLVREVLSTIPKAEIEGLTLDLPSGYGRLNPLLSEVAPRIVEGDWSFYLLQAARTHLAGLKGKQPVGFVRGTALNLPFQNRAFDLVLSVRLCHHIADYDERMQYLREILRISNRWLVFTYFDTASIKNRIHAFKIRFVDKPPKRTLTKAEVQGAASMAGFDVVSCVPLSRLFSGHNYTVLRRRGT